MIFTEPVFFSVKSSGATLQKRHHPRGPYVICILFDGSFDSSPKKTIGWFLTAFLGLHDIENRQNILEEQQFFTKQNTTIFCKKIGFRMVNILQKNAILFYQVFLVLVSICIGWTFSIRTDVVEVGSDSPCGASWHQWNKSPCAESGKLCGVYPKGFTSEFLYNKRTFLLLVFHVFFDVLLAENDPCWFDIVKIGLKPPPREAS